MRINKCQYACLKEISFDFLIIINFIFNVKYQPPPPPPRPILALNLSRDHDLNKLKLTLAMDASTQVTAFWPIGF